MNETHYKIWKIPKRNGSFRVIAEPLPDLKRKQKAILKWLISRGIRASPYAHGFVHGRSTATHARLHTGKKAVLGVDLENCFGMTKGRMIYAALRREGVNHETCNDIVEACALDGSLPQGAPSSPFLMNLVLKEADFRLAGLAKKRGAKIEITYSRYADDLVFSSDEEKINHLLPVIDRIVSECGYSLNPRKTRVMRSGFRQEVTGIVVNRFPNLPRTEKRLFRARLHGMKKSLVAGNPFDAKAFQRVSGMAAYVNAIRPDLATRFRQDLREIKRLEAMRRA